MDSVLAATARTEQRSRLLPARLVVYFVLAMCLLPGHSYAQVARLVIEWWAERRSPAGLTLPSTAAIWNARARLGVEPLKQLLATALSPTARSDTGGARYRTWRVAAIETAMFSVADTPANVEVFGRPPSPRPVERGARYPQIAMAGLVELATSALLDAGVTSGRPGALAPAHAMVASLRPDMLVLADPESVDISLWRAAAATGADLLWRSPDGFRTTAVRRLPDGSHVGEIIDRPDGRQALQRTRVRVLEHAVAGREARQRLCTTILDPAAAPADELVHLHAQSWPRATMDGIKVVFGGSHLVLRSRHPHGAEQELYALLLVHHAIRPLLVEDSHVSPSAIAYADLTRVASRSPTVPRPSRSPRVRTVVPAQT